MSSTELTHFNKNFRIVFQSKEKNKGKRIRFIIGAGKLSYYIGNENAESCFKKALSMMDDKMRFKFRKAGIVDFYVK